MNEYEFIAYSADGQPQRGVMTATSVQDARQQLRTQGLSPRALQPATKNAARSTKRKVSPNDRALADWAYRLDTLLQGGLSIEKALATIPASKPGRTPTPIEVASESLLDGVRRGMPPFAAAARSGYFAASVICLLEAAENTGDLPGSFRAIAQEARSRQTQRELVRSALLYPITLSIFAAATVVFMLVVVVPRFEPVFSRAKATIPDNTVRILNASSWLLENWAWSLLAFCGTSLLILVLYRQGHLSNVGARIWRQLPGLSSYYRWKVEAQLCLGLARYLNAGVQLPTALGLLEDSMNQTKLSSIIGEVRRNVTAGESLSSALDKHSLIHEDTHALIHSGEESGAVSDVLFLIGTSARKNAEHKFGTVLKLIEPGLVLLIGLIIGSIILSIFQAILSVNDAVL